MSDDLIISEAIRLVDEGHKVVFAVKGRSMLPFIIGGRDSVQLERPSESQVGDVVLAWVYPGRYVVHRVFRIEGERVTLMGDGNLGGTETCRLCDIKAKAAFVVRPDGRRRNLCSSWMLRAAKIWRWLLPVRRYLLFIYRKLHHL